RGFLEDEKVFRVVLVLRLVAGIRERAELDHQWHAIVALQDVAPVAISRVVAADDLVDAIVDRRQLGGVFAEDRDLAMHGERLADREIGLAATGRATVANDVRFAEVRESLRAGQRAPR